MASPGWSGGQYSIFRALFGLCLSVRFVQLALSAEPSFVTVLLAAGAALSVLLLIGLYDRAAALALLCLVAGLYVAGPRAGDPSYAFAGWLLVAHACLPPAPYGSLAARGRPDPAGDWRMPGFIHGSAWVLLAALYGYSGYAGLTSPSWVDGTALLQPPLPVSVAARMTFALELLFVPLALLRSLRPALWLAMLVARLCLLALLAQLSAMTDSTSPGSAIVLLHLFTFDPAWIRPLRPKKEEILFYDGHCGLCHRSVRFVLAEGGPTGPFRFAPLEGDLFRTTVPEHLRRGLPDSLVLQTADGRLLTRSAGAIGILRRLGGLWRAFGELARLVPARVLDALYDAVARVRHRLFRPPPDVCPIIPPHLRNRFEL